MIKALTFVKVHWAHWVGGLISRELIFSEFKSPVGLRFRKTLSFCAEYSIRPDYETVRFTFPSFAGRLALFVLLSDADVSNYTSVNSRDRWNTIYRVKIYCIGP